MLFLRNAFIVFAVIAIIVILFLYFASVTQPFKDQPPRNGLIFQSGGVMSPWSAYVVDFDSDMADFYESASSSPKIKKLDPGVIADIRALADRAIAAPYSSSAPTGDINMRLEVSEAGKISETNTYGPVLDAKQPINLLQDLLAKLFSV